MNNINTNTKKPNKLFWFVVCIAILAAGFGSFNLLKALKHEPEQRQQTIQVPQVETLALSYRTSPLLIEGNGIVSPRSEISLSSQVNGEITNIHPNLVTGGSFQKGEIIIQIDPRTFQANLAEAQASKAASESSLSFLTKRIARLQSLRNEGYAGEEELDDAISQRDQALANIARLEASITSRQLDLERSTIKAPFNGKILSESVDIGDVVAPGRELARFYASEQLEVIVSLNAEDASFIPGLWEQNNSTEANAWVYVNHGGLQYQWDAVLDRVEADIDRTTRTIDVVVKALNPTQAGQLTVSNPNSSITKEAPPLMIGMYGKIAIEGMSLENHFVLPLGAIHNGNTIWVADSENRLRIETVEIVRQEGNFAVLLAPQLNQGSQIIISNIALVSDGMRVQANPVGGSAQ